MFRHNTGNLVSWPLPASQRYFWFLLGLVNLRLRLQFVEYLFNLCEISWYLNINIMCTGPTVNILSSDNITPDRTAELRKCWINIWLFGIEIFWNIFEISPASLDGVSFVCLMMSCWTENGLDRTFVLLLHHSSGGVYSTSTPPSSPSSPSSSSEISSLQGSANHFNADKQTKSIKGSADSCLTIPSLTLLLSAYRTASAVQSVQIAKTQTWQ